MTSEEPAEEFIKHYLVLVPCQSFADFQKVLDLKVSEYKMFFVSWNVTDSLRWFRA